MKTGMRICRENALAGTTFLLAAVMVAACSPAPPADGEGGTRADTSAEASAPAPDAGAPARQASTPMGAALPGLFDVMWGLEDDMATVTRGLWMENFDTIQAGARAVAGHPTLPPDEVEQVAGVLGDEMEVFKAMDTQVHDLSVELAEAAAVGNLATVLELDAELRVGCVSCHSTFRERLREAIR